MNTQELVKQRLIGEDLTWLKQGAAELAKVSLKDNATRENG